MKKKVKGAHYTVDFFGCDIEQIDSLEFWQDLLPAAAKEGGLDVLYSYYHPFDPQGITGFLLLSSSHISFHTWPEYNYVACDVFSCTSGEETERSVSFIKKAIKHTKNSTQKIMRGYVIMDYFVSPIYSTGATEYIKVDKKISEIKSSFQKILIFDSAKYGRCMAIDGLMQTSVSDHKIYDKAILRKYKSTQDTILILGGGDGYVAEEILSRNPLAKITIIDLDQMVVSASKRYLGQKVFNNPNVKVIIGDALHHLSLFEKESFDGIVIDLTDNPIGSKNGTRELRNFYNKLFPMAHNTLKKKGWLGMQAGATSVKGKKYVDSVKIIEPILMSQFGNIEHKSVLIPSFSESNSFLYAQKK
jgi:spermidine synthase